ncbi:MAG TPA: rubrerythrin family protein [Candidatus Baltobacteraceae bacterium]|nr:rubrerythrin family protein [Candidatus Baltobacteraceae bacterium]
MRTKLARNLVAAILGATLFTGGIALGAQLQASTQKDLMTAMQGEAFAYLQYMAFADKARLQGYPQIAALFEKTANVEWKSHFTTHAYQYGLVKDTAQNLQRAITGENYETTTMYPQMAQRAKAAGDTSVATIFSAVGKDEATHRDQYQAALKQLQSGK